MPVFTLQGYYSYMYIQLPVPALLPFDSNMKTPSLEQE